MKPGTYKAQMKMKKSRDFFLFQLQHHLEVNEAGEIVEPYFLDLDTGMSIQFEPPRKWDKALLPQYHIKPA